MLKLSCVTQHTITFFIINIQPAWKYISTTIFRRFDFLMTDIGFTIIMFFFLFRRKLVKNDLC